MGTNWKAGLIFWRPHTDAEGVNYPLEHGVSGAMEQKTGLRTGVCGVSQGS